MPVAIGSALSFDDVVAVAVAGEKVELPPDLEERMAPSRRIVEEAVTSGKTIYGVTTGFGGLSNVRIDPTEAARLQRDIVRSHATAVGTPLPSEVVRAMMLLRARTFAFGISGVRPLLVERFAQMLNEGIHPVVPSQGSLGASGDLALLAHLALPIIGEGRVERDGSVLDAADALGAVDLQPIELSFKEGLALVNGTEAMLALGILVCRRSEALAKLADLSGAMTLEACLGTDRAFDEDLVSLRKHPGALLSAANLRRALAGSEIVASHRESDHLVQDAYSLRCMPQVHGAYRDGIAYVRSMLEAELASAIDNPTILVDRNEMLSGGNFHGEALGLSLDHLGLCLAGYGTISERRVARARRSAAEQRTPGVPHRGPGPPLRFHADSIHRGLAGVREPHLVFPRFLRLDLDVGRTGGSRLHGSDFGSQSRADPREHGACDRDRVPLRRPGTRSEGRPDPGARHRRRAENDSGRLAGPERRSLAVRRYRGGPPPDGRRRVTDIGGGRDRRTGLTDGSRRVSG